jgi:hypothetical protein
VNRILITLAAVVALVLSSCTDDDAARNDPNRRLTAIYSEVIPAVATHERPDLLADEPLDVVIYIAPREHVEIGIDVQVGIINELADWADIRFIDEFEEAIDRGEPNQPVRDNSVLIGLGSIPEGATTVEVFADRYEYADELTTFEITLTGRADEWAVDGPIQTTRISLHGTTG